ncbi:MAG: hypothetical protein GY714_31355 [Desulfobacterales bacterium]|nr:hypothetical protein [Desulfobacterales bacterium]MCP4159417.1 hypothetical protein [Deltaproteobacteria bacterium]
MKFFKLLIIAVLMTSCSVKELHPLSLNQPDYTNTLTRRGGSISVPDDFRFFLSKKLHKGIITQFDGSGIKGSFEKVEYKYKMSNRKLADYYLENILDGSNEKAIRKIIGKDLYLITAISKDRTEEILTALYMINQRTLYIVQMTSDIDVLTTKNDVAFKIINSIKKTDINLNERIRRGFIKFKASDTDYKWYGDLKKEIGFKIYSKKSKFRITLTKTKHKNIDQYVKNITSKKFDIIPFETDILIKDKRIRKKNVGISDNSKYYSSVFFIFRDGTHNILVTISYKKIKKLKPLEVVNHISVKTLLKYLIY